MRRLIDARIALLGVGSGFLAGLLGIGGGVVMVPALIALARRGQRQAHVISLAAIVPIAVAALIVYALRGDVRLGAGLALGAGGLVGGHVGARLLNRVNETLLRRLFGGLLVVVAVVTVLR